LPAGGILVVGGAPDSQSRQRYADTEVWVPSAAAFRIGPQLRDGRYKLTDAVLALSDGRVIVAGGPTLDIIDLGAGTARALPAGGLGARRSFQTLSLVGRDRVLVAGAMTATSGPRAKPGWCRSPEPTGSPGAPDSTARPRRTEDHASHAPWTVLRAVA
jgi:hypothetical protein